jgi:hypothetical protein
LVLNPDTRSAAFLGAEVDSQGLSELSVHAEDRYTWYAAVVYDDRSRCLMARMAMDPADPKLGSIEYRRVARSRGCSGIRATEVFSRDPLPSERE